MREWNEEYRAEGGIPVDLITTLKNMGWNLTHRLGIPDIIDILIVAVILYELLILTRRTRGSALLKGLLVFLIIAGLSNILGLTSLNWIMMVILNNGALVLIILFQPELRKALEQMGRSSLFRKSSRKNADNDSTILVSEIVQTLVDLSQRRVGALIALEQNTGLQEWIQTGTALNAEISAPLLENIFEPNTPLHDGAVIIRNDRIAAAACILPLTEASGVSRALGTRHRAGLGLSENTDALVLIVSEETGIISMAKGGQLTRPMTAEMLRKVLSEIYTEEPTRVVAFVRNLFKNKEESNAHES